MQKRQIKRLNFNYANINIAHIHTYIYIHICIYIIHMGKGGAKRTPLTSTNVGFNLQNFLIFIVNPFNTLV